jgi:hypothetical protein
MNDAQFSAYSTYIRALADQVLLADWEIELDRSVSDHGTWAQVTVQSEENFARVYVNWPEFFAHSPEERREWLVHECVHLHLDRPQRIMNQLAAQISGDVTAFAKEAHRKEIEICVQRIARILAPHLPLPPSEGA